MKFYGTFSILFYFLFVGVIVSQDQSQLYQIDQVEFTGLKKTKEAYLLSILNAKSNQEITLNQIEEDLQVLKNFSGFADAEYILESTYKGYTLIYQLTERNTLLPSLNFGGIRDNIWFSVGGVDNNFRGYGDLFFGHYLNNNGRHSAQIYFKKRRLLRSEWGYSASLQKWTSDEPIYFDQGAVDYRYDNNGLGMSLIRNFGLTKSIELGGILFQETYTKNNDQILENPPGPDDFGINKFLTKLTLNDNAINYHFFYLKGYQTTLTLQNVMGIDSKIRFNSAMLENKFFFRPREKVNVALRTRFALSTNDDTPFAPFVADSHVNIRGIGNRIDRGTAQLVINAESRYTIHYEKDGDWSSQFVIFMDAGTWRTPGESLKQILDVDIFRQFVGCGIRINYLKVFGATLRVDYGVDLYNPSQRGLVIGLGQYY